MLSGYYTQALLCRTVFSHAVRAKNEGLPNSRTSVWVVFSYFCCIDNNAGLLTTMSQSDASDSFEEEILCLPGNENTGKQAETPSIIFSSAYGKAT